MSWQIFVTILHWNCWNGIFCFKKKIKIGGAIKNTECLEQASAEVSTSWNLNDLIAFEFLSWIVEAKTRSHRLLRWCVVHFRVNGYGNAESIPYLDDYLKDIIDEESFYDWCVEQGYFESDEDDEE